METPRFNKKKKFRFNKSEDKPHQGKIFFKVLARFSNIVPKILAFENPFQTQSLDIFKYGCVLLLFYSYISMPNKIL